MRIFAVCLVFALCCCCARSEIDTDCDLAAGCRTLDSQCEYDKECASAVCMHGRCVRDQTGKGCSVDADCAQFYSFSMCHNYACVRRSLNNDSCTHSYQCVSEACVSGRCLARQINDSCTHPLQCADGLWCALESGRCERAAPIDAACTDDWQCADDLCADQRCRNTSWIGARGAECFATEQCAASLLCVNSTCADLPPLSDPSVSCGHVNRCPSTTLYDCRCVRGSRLPRCIPADPSCGQARRELRQCGRRNGCETRVVSLRAEQCLRANCSAEAQIYVECIGRRNTGCGDVAVQAAFEIDSADWWIAAPTVSRRMSRLVVWQIALSAAAFFVCALAFLYAAMKFTRARTI